MSEVIFVQPDGKRRAVDVAMGVTLMQAAVSSGVHGIVAECSGGATCGTCHVVVDALWVSRLTEPDSIEDGLLDFTAAPREPGSRLSCQIRMQPAYDGLVVTVVDRQT